MSRVGEVNYAAQNVANGTEQAKPDAPVVPAQAEQESSGDSRIGELAYTGNTVKYRVLSENEAFQAGGPPPVNDLATEATVTRTGGRIIIDAGAGDDNVSVTRDAATGGVTVNVNGARRTFTGADANRLTIRAGDGNDTVTVDSGVTVRLTIEGGAGDDRLTGGGGADTIRGGAGADTIEAGEGNDTVYGGAGRDYINGSRGNDRLYGGDGDDVVYGGDGNDSIQGNGGADYLEGSRGNDSILGGAGRDVISGGLGDDQLRGGDGDDTLYAGGGADRVYGGRGSNSVYAQRGDTVERSNARTGVRNAVVYVELTGNPGGTGVRVNGSAEFRERVEADLEMLRSSPTGRQMLTAYDTSGHVVTINETNGGNGATFPDRGVPGRPQPWYDPNTATTGAAVDGIISYNTQRVTVGGNDRPPVVGLYHEMAHAYDYTHGTLQPGTYNGPGVDNGANNRERVAVGLPIDHDNNPATPERTDPNHPTAVTENALRDELRIGRRNTYN